jgi:exodeoxyribonuclease V alpha subunit
MSNTSSLDNIKSRLGFMPDLLASPYQDIAYLNQDEFNTALVGCSMPDVACARYEVAKSVERAISGHNIGARISSDTMNIIQRDAPTSGVTFVNDFALSTDIYQSELTFYKLLFTQHKKSVATTQAATNAITHVKNGFSDNIKKNDEQKNALINALQVSLSLITGGPGTGKSNTVKGIVRTYISHSVLPANQICLLTPTNCAKNIYSDAECRVSTIHKALGFNPFSLSYKYNSANPLPYQLVIVDEATMIGLDIFIALLSAIHPSARLVVVGDIDQFGPISLGDCFYDMVQLKCFASVNLNINYRSNAEINALAKAVKSNSAYSFAETNSTHLISAPADPRAYYEKLLKILLRLQEAGVSIIDDLQILAATNDNLGSKNEINQLVHSAITPNNHPIDIGDKIAIGKTAAAFFEGEHAQVIDVSETGNVFKVVNSRNPDGAFIKSPSRPTLSHCLTIHEAQGSQWSDGLICVQKKDLHWIGKRGLATAISRFMRSATIYTDASESELLSVTNAKRLTLAGAINYDIASLIKMCSEDARR